MLSVMFYSKTSMAGSSLGPCIFIRDLGNSSHCGLIEALCQEANDDNIRKSFLSSIQ